jgi:very-short-patch-repair endonuclease
MRLTEAALALLGRQHFVATVDQLLDRGVGRRSIIRARQAGELVTVMGGVVRLAGSPETLESRAMSLLLKVDGRGMVADATAGRLWGIPKLPRTRLTIMVPYGCRPAVPEWARVIRSRWIDDYPVLRSDGLVATSPERTLFELGARFGAERFEHAAENLWNRQLITPDSARLYLNAIRGKGRTGVSRLEAWLDQVQTRPRRASQSSLEVGLAQALEQLGLPRPERQFALVVDGGRAVIHLDLAWPERRLGVEPGHAVFHAGRDAMRRDYERDRWCDEQGWRVIRFDDLELRDLHRCARQVARIFTRRPVFPPPPGSVS